MLREYIAELSKIKFLTREEELALWEKEACGDEEAHNKLMSSYQPLVLKTALSFRLPEEMTLELMQEGMVGLLEAAENYDYRKGVAFSIFAIHRIRGSMCDFLGKEYSNCNLSLDRQVDDGFKLADFILDDCPRPEEVAERHFVTDRVNKAVDRLPEKEKQVLKGIYIDGCSASDMADSISVSTNYVYRLQKQGVRRVRGMLSRFMSELKPE